MTWRFDETGRAFASIRRRAMRTSRVLLFPLCLLTVVEWFLPAARRTCAALEERAEPPTSSTPTIRAAGRKVRFLGLLKTSRPFLNPSLLSREAPGVQLPGALPSFAPFFPYRKEASLPTAFLSEEQSSESTRKDTPACGSRPHDAIVGPAGEDWRHRRQSFYSGGSVCGTGYRAKAAGPAVYRKLRRR